MVVLLEADSFWQVWEFSCTGMKKIRYKCGGRWFWLDELAECEKTEWRDFINRIRTSGNGSGGNKFNI